MVRQYKDEGEGPIQGRNGPHSGHPQVGDSRYGQAQVQFNPVELPLPQSPRGQVQSLPAHHQLQGLQKAIQ